jgi:hypothetical protein
LGDEVCRWTERNSCHSGIAKERDQFESESNEKEQWLNITQLIDRIAQTWNVQKDEIDDNQCGCELECASKCPSSGSTLSVRALRGGFELIE